MMSLLSSCLLALAAAQGADPTAQAPAASHTQSEKLLDELIAKTSQLKSFTAVYEMTLVTTDVTPPTTQVNQLHIEYQAPDKMRLDMSSDAQHGSQWLVGGVLVLHGESGKPMNARVDMRAIDVEFASAERAFEDAFPGEKAPSGEPGSVVDMSWSFDERAQKANFSLQLSDRHAARTPLGWLTELRERGETPSESGAQLVLDDGGHIKVAISKRSGFVESFSGESPHGEMLVKLESLETDNAIDPQRFVLPSAPSVDADSSANIRDAMRTARAVASRYAIYRRAGNATADEWANAGRTKIGAVLRVVHELMLDTVCKDLRARSQKHGEEIAAWLHKLEDDGRSAEELANTRSAQLAKLNETLDQQSNNYSAHLAVPEHSPPFARGDELLKLEREVASKAFDELVRAPIVHDFEHATSLKKE
jgi:hypothetical protein